MGKGGGKCASREQTAASMRTPRLPATRPTPATNPAIEDKALESEGSLEPLISKNEETLRHDPPGDVDDDIDVDVNFDQPEGAYHGTESGRRLLAASPASDYQSEYHTAQPSPALSFSSGRRTPDTLYHSGPEDLQSYMASPAHPPGMPSPTKYLRSTVDEPVAPLPDDDDLFPAADTPVPSTSNASVPRPGVLRKRHSMVSSSSAQGGSRSLLTSLSMPAPVGRLGERSKAFSASPARETEEVISLVQLGSRKEDEVTVAAPSAAIELPNVITPQEVQASKYSTDVGENWELVSPQPRSITSEWVGVPKRDTEAAVAGVAESIEDTPQQKDFAEVAIEREIGKPSATTDVGPKGLLVDHVVEGSLQSGLVSESHDGEADTVRSLGSDRSDDIETQSVNGDGGGYVLLGPTSAEQLGKSADAAQSTQEAWKAVKPELEVAKSEKPEEPSSARSIAGMSAETKPVSAAVPEEVATLGETEEEEKQEAVEETPIEMKSTGEEAAPLLGKHVEVTFKKPSTDEVVPQLEIVNSPEMSPDCQELPPPDQRVEEAMEAPLSEEIVPKEQRALGTEEVLKKLTIEKEDSPMLDGIVATTGAAEPYEPAAQQLIAERKQIPVAGEEPSRTELPEMVDEKETAIAPSSQDNMEEVGEAPVTAVAVPKHVSVDAKELSKKEFPEMLEEKDTDTAPIPEENMEEVSDAPMPPVAAPKSETIKDQKEVPEEVEPAADEKDVPETSSQETIKPSNRELGAEPENLSIDVEEPTKEEQPEVMVEKGLEGSAAGEEETKNVEPTTETHPTMVPEPGVETAHDSEKVRMDIKAEPQAAEKEFEKEISVAEPLVAISQETKPLEASDREIFNEPRESLVDAEASHSKVEEAEEALNRKEKPAEPEHPEESTETAPLDVSASEMDNAQDNKELTTELESKPVLEEANVGVEHQPVSQTEPGVAPELGAIEQQPEDASWRTWKEELETQGVENVKMDRHPETAPVAPNASQTSPSADEPVMNRGRELPQLLKETEPKVAEEIPKEETREIVEDKCVDFTPSVAKTPTFKQESDKEIEDPQLETDAIPEEGDVKSEAEKQEVCVEAPVAVSQPTESHKEVVSEPQEMPSETENSSKELDPEIVDDREVDLRLVAQDLPISEEPVEHIIEAPAPTFVSRREEIPRSDQEETQAEIQELEVGIPPTNEDTAASESLPVVESEQDTEEVPKETVADEVAPLKGVEPVEVSGKDIVVEPKDMSDRTHGISREPEPAPFEEEDVKDIEEAAPAEYVEEATRTFPSGELASPWAENSTEVLAPEKASTPVERELEVQPTADKVPIPQDFEPDEDTDRELVAQPQDTSTEAEVEAKELAPEMVEKKEIEVTSAVQPPRTTAKHVAVPGEGTSSDEAKVSNTSEEAPTILEDVEEPIKASTFDEVAPEVDEEKVAHPSDGMATSVEAELEAPQPDKAEQTMNSAEDTSNVPEEPKIEPTTEELPEAEPIEAVNSDLVIGPRDDVNEEPKDLDSKALEGHNIVAAGAETQSPLEQVKESAELHPSDEVPEVEEEKTEVIPAGDQTLAPNENVETSEPPLSDMIVPDVETAKDIDTVPRELDNEPLGEEGGLEGEPPIGDPFLAKTHDPELPETTGGDFAAEAETSKAMNGVPKELENQPVTEDRDETESPDVEPIVAASPEETPAETTAHHYVSEPKEISHICSEDHEAVAKHEGLDFLPAPENTPTSELHSEEPIEKRLADVKSPERVSAPDALEVPKDLDSKPVAKEKEFQEGPPIVDPTLVASQDLEHIKSTVRDDVPEVTAKEIPSKELAPTVVEENAINEPFPENAANLDEHVQEEPSGAEATPAVIDEKDVETEPTETTQDEEIPEELEARLAEVATDSTPVMDDESHFAEPTKDRTLKPDVAYRKTVADPALDEAPITPTKEPVLVEEAPTDVPTKDQESDLVGERKLQAPPPIEEHDVIEEMPIQEAASEATLEPPPEGVKEDDLRASLPHCKVKEPESARADVVQEASDYANPEPVSSERESEIVDDTVLKAGPEGVEDKAMHPDKFEDSLIAGSAKEVAQEPETEVVEQKDIKDPLAKQQVQEKEDTSSQEAASAAEGVQEALESPSSDETLHGVEDVTEKLPKELEAKPEEKEQESEHSFFPAIVGMLPRPKPVFAPAAEEPPTTAEHVQSPLEPPQIDVSREGESLESTEAENTKENPLNPLSEVIVNASQSEPEVEEQELDAIREDFTGQAPLNPSNGFIEDKKIEAPFAEAKVEENKNGRSDVVQGTPIEETTKEAALQPESEMVAESDRPEQHEIDETAKEGAWEPEGEAVTEKDSLPPTADSEEIVEDRDPTLPTSALEMVEKEPLQADEVDQAPAQIGASIPDVTEEAPIAETTREVGVKPESKADGQQDFEVPLAEPQVEEKDVAADLISTLDGSTRTVPFEPEREQVQEKEEGLHLAKSGVEEQERAQSDVVEAAIVTDSTKEDPSKPAVDSVEENQLKASVREAERVEKQAVVVEEAPNDTSTKESGLEPEEELVENELEPSLPQPEDVKEPAQLDGVEAAPVNDSIEEVASKPEEDLVENKELEDSLPEAEGVEKQVDVVEEAPTDKTTKEVALGPQKELVTKELETSLHEPEDVEEPAQTVEVEAAPADDSSEKFASNPEGQVVELKTSLPEAEEVEKQADVVEEAPPNKSPKELALEPENHSLGDELESSLLGPRDIEEPAQTVGIDAAPVYDSTTEIASKSQGDLVDRTDLEASLPKAEGVEKQADVVEEARDDTSTEETGLEPQEEMVEKGLEHSLPQPDDVGEPAQTDGVEAAPSDDSTQNVASKREEDLVRNDEVEYSLPEEEEVEKKADVVEEAPTDMSSKEVGLEPQELLITENLGPSPSGPENVEEPAQVGIEPPPVDDSTKDVALKPEGDFIEENELEAQLPKAEEVQKHPDVVEEAPAPTHKEVGLEPGEELDEKELEATLPEPENIEEQAQTVAIETAPAYDSTKEIASKSQGDLVDKTELEASLPKAERVENQADVVEARKDTSTKETGLEPQEERVEKGFEPSLPQPEDVREPAQTDGVEAAPFDDSTQNVTSKPEEELVRNDEVDDSLPEEKEVGKKADVVEEAPNDMSSTEVGLDPQELLITQDLGPSPSEPDNVEEQAQVGVEPTPVDDSTKEVALKPEEGFIEENELEAQLPKADQVQKHPDLVEKAPAPSDKEFGREPEGEFVEKELEPSLPEPENIEEQAQTVGIDAVYDSTTEIASKSQGDLVDRTDLEASLPKAEGVEKQADVVEEARDDTSTEETGLEPQEEMVEKGLEPSLPQLEDVGEPAQTDGVEAAPFDDSTQNVASKPEEDLVRKDELEDSLPEEEQVEKKADVIEEAPTDMSSKEVSMEPQELLITKDLGPSPSEPENVEEQAQVEVEPTPVDDSTKDVALKPEEDFIEENELEAQLPKAEEVQKHPDLVEETPAPTHKEVGLEPEGEFVEKELEPSLPEPEHIEEQAQTVGIEAAPVASEIEGPAVENQARLGEREVEEKEPPHGDESTVEAIVEPESGWTQGKELDASPVDLGAPKKGVASDVVGEEPLAKSVEEIALEPGTQAPEEIEHDESQTEPEVNHTVIEAPVSGSSGEVALEPESEITSKNEVEIPPVEAKLEEAPERQDGLEEVPSAETTREPAFEPEKLVLDKEELQAPPSEPEVEEREATGPNNMEEDRTGSSTEETLVDPQTGPVGERDEACLPEQEVEEEDATHTDEPIKQLGTDPEPIGEPVLPTPKETSQELVEEFSDKELEALPAGPNKAVESKEPTSFVLPEDIPVEQTSKDMVLGPEDISGPTSRETSEERVGAPAEETELEASPTDPEAPATVEVPEKAPIEEAKMNVLSEPERTPKPVLPTFSDEKDLKGSLRQPTEVKPADSIVQEEPIAQTSKEVKEDRVLPHPGPVSQGHEEEAGEPVQELEQEANEQELTPADVLEKTSTGEVNLNPDSQFIKGEKTQAPDAKAEVEEKEAPRSDVVQENPTDDTLKEAALEPESEMAIEENARKADSQAYEIGDSTKGETVKENDSFPSTAESEKEDLRQADELQQATFAGYPMDTALRPEGEVVEGKDLTMPTAALEMVKKDVSQDDQVDQAPVHGGEAIAPDVIEEEHMNETTKEAGVEPEGEADEQQEFEVPLAGPEVEEQDDVADVLHNLNDSTKTVPFEPMQQQVEKKDWVLPLNKREVIEEEPVQTDVAKAAPVDDSANEVPSRDLIGDDKFEASLPQAEGVEAHTDVVEEQPTDNSTKEIGVEPKDEVVQKELEPPLPEPEDVAQHADVVDEGPAAESTKEVDSEPEGPAVENQATLGEREVEEKEPPQADESTEQAIVEPENGWTQGKELDASQVDLEAPKKGVTPDVAGEEPLAKTVKEIVLEPSTEALGEVELDASETEPEVSPTVTDAPNESLREVALEPETEVIGIKKDKVPPVEAKLEESPQRQDELEEVPLAETTTEVAFEPEREALDKEEVQAPPSEPGVEEKDAPSPDDMEKAPTGSSTEETVVEPQTRPGGGRDEACLPEQELEEEGATHTDLLKEAPSDEPIKEWATDPEPVSELVLPNPQETSKELVEELSHSKELEASPADPKAVESKEPTSVLVPEDIAIEQSAKDMISVSEDVSEPLMANSRETSEERVGAPVEEKELEASSTEHGAIEHTKENLLPGTPKPVLATFSNGKDLVGSVAQPTAAEPAEFIVQEETNEKTSMEVHEETVGTHPGAVPQEGCKEQVIGSMQEMKLKAPRAALEAPNTVEVEQGEDTQIKPAQLQEKLPEQEDIVEETPIESTREIAFVSKTDPLTAVSTEQDEQEATELRSSTPTEKEKRKGNWDSVAFQAAEPTQVNEGGSIASQAATKDVKEETAGVSGDFEAVSKSEKRKSDEASVDVHSEGAREVDPIKVSNKVLLTGHEAAAEEPQEEVAVAPKQLEAERDVPKKKSQEAAVDVVVQEDGPSEKETEIGAYSNATFAEVKEATDEVPKECEPTFASYPTSLEEDSSWQKATEWELIAPEAEPLAQRLEEGSKATRGDKDQNAHLDNQPARDAIKGDSSHATDWELVASEMAKSPSRVEEKPKNMLDAPTQEQGGEVAPPVTKIPPSASEVPEWEMVTSERKIAHKDNTQQEPALDVVGNNLTIEMKEPESAGLQQLVPPVEPIPRSKEVSEDLTKEEEKSINTPAVEESTIHAIVELPGEKEEPAEEPVEIETAMSAEIPTERGGFDNDIPLEETTATPNVQESTSETAVRDGQTKTAPVKSVDVMEEPESEGMDIQDATPAVKPTLQIERVSEYLPVQKEAVPAALHLEEPSAETASRGFPVEIEQAPVEVEGPMKKLDSEEVQIGDEEADSVDSRTVPQGLPTKGQTMRNINPTSKEPISKVTSRDLSFKSWHPYMDIAETKTKPRNELAESASPPAETKGVTKIESIQEKSVPTVEEPTAPTTSRDIVVEREQAPGEVEEAHFESVKHELKATIQTEEKPKDLSSEEESDANIEPAIEDPEAARDVGMEAAEQVTKTPADYKEAFEDLPTEDATIPVSDIDEPLPEATESNFPIDEKRDPVDGEVRAQASELEGETGKREVGIPTESKEVKKDLLVEETAISASEPKSNRVPFTTVQAAKGHESHIVQDLEEVQNPLQEVPKKLDSEVVEKVEARRTEATEIPVYTPGLDETAPLQATEGGLGPQLEQVTKEAEKEPATEAVAALEKPEVVAIREKAPEVTLLLPKEPLTSDAPQEPREDTRRKIFVESKTLRGVEEAPKGIAINTPEEETHEAAEEPQTSHAETSGEYLSVWNLKHLQQKYEKLKHKQVLQQEKKNANKVVGLPWPPTRLTHPQDKEETCN